MGKTRDLFKKIRDTKGTFHAKMGSIKDRNGMDLTEAEDIKKRWHEYTEELYKKDLHDPDNHEGVITHLEPDILECEVRWPLESITMNKASGGDGIPVELFQILKDDAVKVLCSICQQIWKTQQWPQDWKRSDFIPIPRRAMPENFPQFIVIHTVKGFGIVNKAEIDVFLELSCFFRDPADVGNLISGPPAFSKSSLSIWKFMVHVHLTPMENFEHYFARV